MTTSNPILLYIYGKVISWTFQKWNKIIEKLKVMTSAKGESPTKFFLKLLRFLFFKFELSLKDNFNSKPLEVYHNSNQLFIPSENFYRVEVSCLVPMLWLKT